MVLGVDLDDLQRESQARQDELKAIAALLPATVSRKATLKAAVHDLRRAPNKGMIVTRGFRKLLRIPSGTARRLRRHS
jgi:hypothetical protein